MCHSEEKKYYSELNFLHQVLEIGIFIDVKLNQSSYV